ncbi:MAG: amidase family protein [archaeon]
MDYKGLTVAEFIKKSKQKEIDFADFYGKLGNEIAALQKKYNYFVTVVENKDISVDSKTKLAGLPISAKDCICTKGVQSTAGSRILEGYVPPFDATVIARAKSEGGVLIGKTVQDEFGFGTFSTNSGYGIPKNPLDPLRSCGGSSGGAAGLTAALCLPHIALGQSTGGSISCPASFCGVVGLTPTYGRVSRYGLIDYANSLDKIGTIGKTVGDARLLYDVISGYDPLDETSIKDEGKKAEKTDIRKARLGVPKEYFTDDMDKGVRKAVEDAIDKLRGLGASVSECSLPHTKYSIPAYYIIAMAEASTNLAKYCGMRYGKEEDPKDKHFDEYFSYVRGKYLGSEAKRRIILGTYTRMAGYRDQYYLKALKVRRLIIDDYKRVFKEFDALVAPTMPFVAPKFSEIKKLTPLECYNADILTGAPNLAGMPMLSLPCGSSKGMPVGLHIMADHMKEDVALDIGEAFEDSS